METDPTVHTLHTGLQRARGAMFQPALGRRVLVFVYPKPAPRLFHTFFCPPLRILALSEEGARLHEQVALPGQWVLLPAARIVVECDPGLPLNDENLKSIAACEEVHRGKTA